MKQLIILFLVRIRVIYLFRPTCLVRAREGVSVHVSVALTDLQRTSFTKEITLNAVSFKFIVVYYHWIGVSIG